MLAPIARALETAHQHQDRIVHRDVKPSNILITKYGTPMLGRHHALFRFTHRFLRCAGKKVKEIEALGNVVVRREGRVATANRAIYYSREEKIVLTGDARILENENQLGGDRIILFVRDDRSIVEGGRVLFYQEKPDERRQRSDSKQDNADERK